MSDKPYEIVKRPKPGDERRRLVKRSGRVIGTDHDIVFHRAVTVEITEKFTEQKYASDRWEETTMHLDTARVIPTLRERIKAWFYEPRPERAKLPRAQVRK